MMPSSSQLMVGMQSMVADTKVHGLGMDVIEVARIETAVKRHPERFARRILAPGEWGRFASGNEPHRYLAKQFAAKEAVAKALGTGIAQGVTFHQLLVLRDALGAPYVELTGVAAQRCQYLGGRSIRISITDEDQWAMAVALVVG